jgi:predicted Zn-dependent protease
MRLGDVQLALRRYREAEETFRRLGELAPHLIQAQYKRGIALAGAKRFAEAAAAFAAVQNFHSDDPDALDYVRKAASALNRLRADTETVKTEAVLPEAFLRWQRLRHAGERRRPRLH